MRRLHRGWRIAFLAAVLALAAVVPASASAQMVLRSFSDGASTSTSELAELAGQFRSGCTKKAVAVKSMSLATALAHIQTQLRRNAGAKALSGFSRSADARSAVKAAGAVFGAIGDGAPWAAIDAALRVHQLDPRDADPLISLAGLVTAQGMPQEGLALLSAAGRLKAKSPAPMGIDVQAVADNNRGYALLLLGQPTQAATYLQTAATKAPLLSEARINLDAAQQCSWALGPGGGQGNPPVIADPPFWREDEASDWTTGASGEPVPVASDIFNLSQTREWTPVNIAIPETPQQGGQMKTYYTSLEGQIESDVIANSTKEANLSSQVYDPNEETMRRRSAVWNALNTAPWQPELRSLSEAWESQDEALLAAINIGTDEGNGGSLDPTRPSWHALRECEGQEEPCSTDLCTSETAALFAKWKPQLAALNDADLRYEAAYWRYATGVAANISDPADHQRMLLDAEDTMLTDRELILKQATLFLMSAEWLPPFECDGGAAAPPGEGSASSQEGSPACPKELEKLPDVNVTDIFKFSVHCEKITFELSGKGWVGPFLNITYNAKEGRTTVFAGAQMEALGAKAQTGAFLTAGPSGLEDGGMRVSESTSGPSFMTQSHTVNLSVAGTVPFSQ
jgi:hypothetical protein